MSTPIDKNSFINSGALMSVSPQEILIGWGKSCWTETPVPPPQISFYFPDYFLHKSTPWLTHEYQIILSAQQVCSLFDVDHKKRPPYHWTIYSQALFMQEMTKLEKLFASKSLLKAVPYVMEKTQQTMKPQQLKTSLAKASRYVLSHQAFIYGFWNSKEGLFGVTPEILFTLDKHQENWIIKTTALAGTSKDKSSLFTEKNLNEHAFVVDGISSSLAPFGKVKKGSLQALELPLLNHLMTPLELILPSPLSFQDLVRALHPTPALGAYPRREGFSWLSQYEKQIPRKRYGAPAGIIKNDSAKCFVGIRNVQWDETGMQIGAGCGVIAESNAKDEWNEILMKLQAIKEVLAL